MKCFGCGKEITTKKAYFDIDNILIPDGYGDFGFCTKKCITDNVMIYMKKMSVINEVE